MDSKKIRVSQEFLDYFNQFRNGIKDQFGVQLSESKTADMILKQIKGKNEKGPIFKI